MGRPTEEQTLLVIPEQLRAHTLQGYWAVVPFGKRLVHFIGSKGAGSFVPEAHRLYAIELCTKLNREIALGGKWLVCWCEFDLKLGMPSHLSMLWMDRDGDVPFIVDSDERLAAQVHGLDDYIQQCAEAHAAWREMIREVGVTEGQQIAAGLGQQSADPRATPDLAPIL